MKTLPQILSTIAVAAAFASSQASAATFITPVVSTGVLPTELNTAILLPLFDSNLGTLTGVTLTLTGGVFVIGEVENVATSPQTFQVSQTTNFLVSDGTGVLPFSSLPPVDLSATVSQTYLNLAPNSPAPFNGTQSGSIMVNIAPGDLGLFQLPGGGTDTVNFITQTSDTFTGGGGNIELNVGTAAEGTIQATYTYTAVPEPSSLLLVGSALVGFGLRRRRR